MTKPSMFRAHPGAFLENSPVNRRSLFAAAACSLGTLVAGSSLEASAAGGNEEQTFGGGVNGSLLYRDTGASDGASWLAGVAPGAVLVSGGTTAAPLWSETPTLKTLMTSATEAVYPFTAKWAGHDPTITGIVGINEGNVGGYTFGCTYQPVLFNNGSGLETTYVNDTWHLGVNVGTLDGGIGRADESKPSLALSFESKYYGFGTFGQEFHLQGVTTDGATPFRPFSVFAAHDASTIGATFTVDTFSVNDRSGNNLFQVSYGNRAFDVIGSKMRFSANNLPAVQQMNAAGSGFVNLLYLDAGNVANIEAPLYVVGPRAGAAAPHPGTFATFQPTTAQSGDTGLKVEFPSVTGTYYGFRIAGRVVGALTNKLTNDAVASNAHAVHVIEVSGSGGGDPFVRFEIPGYRDYSMGIKNSDSATLTFTAGSSLASPALLALPSTGGLRLPKLASDAPAPAAGQGTIFMRQTGGKMQLCVRFPSGATQTIATEP